MTGWEPDVLPGYWQQTIALGPDPDGEGDIVATLVRRGPDRAAAAPTPARRAGGARLHRLLLQHRAGRPLRRPRLRVLRPGPAQVRPVAARRPDPALHHRPGPLRRRTRAVRSTPSRRTPAAAQVLRVRPLRGRADRRRCGSTGCGARRHRRARASTAWCSTARSWICTARRSCASAPTSAAIGGAGPRARKTRVARTPSEGGYGTSLHRDYARRVRLRPATGSRSAASPSRSAGSRHPPRPGPAAPRPRRRRAEPDPALGPQRVARCTDPDAHPARRRGARRHPDRAVGGLHRQPHHRRPDRRRQARRVPLAAGAARSGLPRTGPLAGLATCATGHDARRGVASNAEG